MRNRRLPGTKNLRNKANFWVEEGWAGGGLNGFVGAQVLLWEWEMEEKPRSVRWWGKE